MDGDIGDDGRDELRWLGWEEWEEECGYEDEVNRMKQEVDSKGMVMHVRNKWFVIFKQEDGDVR